MILKYIDPDAVAKKHLSIKVKLSIILAYAIFGIWVATTSLPWYAMLLCFYFSIIFMRVGGEVGFHRYFAHRSYETSTFKKRLLLAWGSLLGIGSCVSWVAVHRTHHRYSDQPGDPHSPKNIGVLRVWLTLWDDNWLADPGVVKDLFKDRWQIFFHRHYFKILISWVVFLSIVSYFVGSITPLAILFGIPCSMVSFFSGTTNAFGHWIGYRNFETDDDSRNHHFTRWILGNAGLHNNHHYRPNDWDFNTRKKWYEFDVEGLIIKYFFIKNP